MTCVSLCYDPHGTLGDKHKSDSVPRLDNIGLISVGVGSSMSTAELQAIADDPDSNNMFTMSNFNQLPSITKNLIDATCRGQSLKA